MQSPDVPTYEELGTQLVADMKVHLPRWEWRGVVLPKGVRIGVIGKPPGGKECGAWTFTDDYRDNPEKAVLQLRDEFLRLLEEDVALTRAAKEIACLKALLRYWLAACPETCGQCDDVRKRAEEAVKENDPTTPMPY